MHSGVVELVEISNAADSRLDDYRNLTDLALRSVSEPAGGLYIAESAKVIERAVAAGHLPRSIMVQRRWVRGVCDIVRHLDVPVLVVPDAVAESVTGYAVHRGALASMHRPALPEVAASIANASLVLILEDIGDHTNVGAAFRAAAALGADAVLVSSRCADPLYRRSVRVSMGGVFQVPWTRMTDWNSAATDLRNYGFEIAALALDDRAVTLAEYARMRAPKTALVLGSEGAGLTHEALSLADRLVTIPMSGGVDSLNVAAAASVALWAMNPR